MNRRLVRWLVVVLALGVVGTLPGGPVAAQVRVTVVDDTTETDTPPIFLDSVPRVLNLPAFYSRLVYPRALAREGISGEIVYEFWITKEGVLEKAVVVRTDHPEFEAATRPHLAMLRFSRGWAGGQPVACLVRQPIRFQLND
ncbi:MAG: TonB family protein [Bacteroidia bacterium]|nr:TonB family protein [Bacteroidia bacterium]